MGVTGVGKSTFISHFNHNAEIGAGLQSREFPTLNVCYYVQNQRD